MNRKEACALAARLFAAEVDAPLYRGLGDLVDPELRAMDEAQALEELAAEYCRLFLGPKPPCPPYASVQRGEAMLGGRAQARLKGFLQLHGFVVNDELRAASLDHVAVYLAVLAHLEDPRSFLQEYVWTWVPGFLESVAAAARWKFYRNVARLTGAAIGERPDALPIP